MTDINEAVLEEALDKVRAVIGFTAGRLEALPVDVMKEVDVEAAVSRLDSWGGVDIMFNNAGIMHPRDGDAGECPADIWDLTMNVNVKGVWFGCKHAVSSMRRHGKKNGSIINTASMVALVGSATPQVAYTASKGAVLALTRELAVVHAKEGKCRPSRNERSEIDQKF
jgi:NAD(P)-dependent dehydrogenase (short-subunit alcohol dehydrogenase family)